MDEERIFALLFDETRKLGIEPGEGNAASRIRAAARKAALELQSTESTEVNLPFLGATASGPVHLVVRLPKQGASSGPRLDPRVKLS